MGQTGCSLEKYCCSTGEILSEALKCFADRHGRPPALCGLGAMSRSAAGTVTPGPTSVPPPSLDSRQSTLVAHCTHTADDHWCCVAQVVVLQKLEGDHQQSSTCHLSTSIIFFTTLSQCTFYFFIDGRKSYFHQSICFVTLKYRKVQLSAQCNTYMWLRMHRGRVSSPLPSGH